MRARSDGHGPSQRDAETVTLAMPAAIPDDAVARESVAIDLDGGADADSLRWSWSCIADQIGRCTRELYSRPVV